MQRGERQLLSDLDDILETIRRKAWDAIKDDVRKHGLRVIENSVKEHPRYGKQFVVVIQEGDDET